jgi:hypothetical protein
LRSKCIDDKIVLRRRIDAVDAVLPERKVRSKIKLTEDDVDAAKLSDAVRNAVHAHGGNRKAWYAAVSKRVPDFPASRTLYQWTQNSGRREKRTYAALLVGLRLSPEDLNTEIVAERSSVEDILEEDDLYSAINNIIDRIDRVGGCREIRLCAMHGTDHRRVVPEAQHPKAWEGFVRRIRRCTDRKDWRVEVLYNVPNKARLDQILGRLRRADKAENHEVRAYGIDGSVQILCPMIIGDRDAFLGLSHPRYYRTGHALYVQGRDKIAFVRRYWKTLWDGARIIRSEAGANNSDIQNIEHEMEVGGKRKR